MMIGRLAKRARRQRRGRHLQRIAGGRAARGVASAMPRWGGLLIALTSLALVPHAAAASRLILDAPFSDFAVVQHDRPIFVHGRAAPAQGVEATIAGVTRVTSAAADGRWTVEFPARHSGDLFDLTVRSGTSVVSAHNLQAGDVFLCSGQSNMEFPLSKSAWNPDQTQNPADRNIHILQIARDRSETPLAAFRQPPVWQIADGHSGDFSAICLMFGRAVANARHEPVGLIGDYWGATPIESWLPRDAIAAAGGMEHEGAVLDAFRSDPVAAKARYGAAIADAWATKDGRPRMGYANIYNAMVAPLDGYSLAGALWYQGENNANQGNSVAAYRAKLSALMASWRQLFGQNLPFLVIQLSSFDPQPDVARDNGWAQVREAQREAVRADRHAALVVTIDVGERLDIHPPLKLPVAERAFNAARHIIYGEAIAPSGPEATAAIRDHHRLHVAVENATGKLVARTWGRPGPFELCHGDGAETDCRFVDAQLDAGAIRIDEPTGFHADQVRYCWGGAPQCNVMDTTQLPLGPFELPISDAGHE